MILLIKGVITRNYIYDLKHLNVIKKIQKSFDIFDSFRIRISLPRERDYSESTIASARAKHLDHQETFCVWAEQMERKCYLQSGRSFEDSSVKTITDRHTDYTLRLETCSLNGHLLKPFWRWVWAQGASPATPMPTSGTVWARIGTGPWFLSTSGTN